MDNGLYISLEGLLDRAPADHPCQRWRGILQFGDVGLCKPAWCDRTWIITTGRDQERALARQADVMTPEPVVVSLPLMNSVRYGWSDRPFENVKEVAADVCASNSNPEEVN